MSKTKKIIIFITVIALIVSIFSFSASAVSYNGSCIDHVYSDGVKYYRIVHTPTYSIQVDSYGYSNYLVDAYFCDDITSGWLYWRIPINDNLSKGTEISLSIKILKRKSNNLCEVNIADFSNGLFIYPNQNRISLNDEWELHSVSDTVKLDNNTSNLCLNVLNDIGSLYIYSLSVSINNTTAIVSSINSFNNSLGGVTQSINDNTDKKAEEIIQNQNDNTDKQIQADKDLQESEKNQASESGNNNVNNVTGAIPDNSTSVASAFGKLANCMIHDSTNATIKFPGIKIPALKPFTYEETILLCEQDIDFEYYFTLIPDKILKLVRAFFTMCLIIYCFKEMYGLLGFIFTSKDGGGANE